MNGRVTGTVRGTVRGLVPSAGAAFPANLAGDVVARYESGAGIVDDGVTVSQWDDLSGNDNHLQFTVDPALSAGPRGGKCPKGTGTAWGQVDYTGYPDTSPALPWVRAVVFRHDTGALAGAADEFLVDGKGTVNRASVWYDEGLDEFAYYGGLAIYTRITLDDGWHLFVFVLDNDASHVHFDGLRTNDNASAGNHLCDGVTMFRRHADNGTALWRGEIAALVDVINVTDLDQVTAELHHYLLSKYFSAAEKSAAFASLAPLLGDAWSYATPEPSGAPGAPPAIDIRAESLPAVGDAVSVWADSGTFDNDLEQADASRQPVVVAGPYARFDGALDHIPAAALSGGGNLTDVAIMVRFRPNTVPLGNLRGVIGDNSTSASRWAINGRSDNGLQLFHNGNYFPLGQLTQGDDYVVILNLKDGYVHSFQNGVTPRDMITTIAAFALESLGVGSLYPDGTNPGNVDISDVRVFRRSLLGAEIRRLETEFDCGPTQRILLEGDSLMNDVNGVLPGLFPSTVDFPNLWRGGEDTSQMVTQIGSNNGLSLAIPNGPNGVAVIWGGANDHPGNEVTAHANLRKLWLKAKSLGFRVVAINVMRSSGIDGSAWETERQALNALIAADDGAGYYDVLVDADAFMDAQTATNPYYDDLDLFRDGVHMNLNPGKGCELLCAEIKTAIDSV